MEKDENIIQLINCMLDEIQNSLSAQGEGVVWEKLTDPNLRLVPRDTPYLFKLGRKTAKVRLQYSSSYLGIEQKDGQGNDQAGS